MALIIQNRGGPILRGSYLLVSYNSEIDILWGILSNQNLHSSEILLSPSKQKKDIPYGWATGHGVSSLRPASYPRLWLIGSRWPADTSQTWFQEEDLDVGLRHMRLFTWRELSLLLCTALYSHETERSCGRSWWFAFSGGDSACAGHQCPEEQAITGPPCGGWGLPRCLLRAQPVLSPRALPCHRALRTLVLLWHSQHPLPR